MLPSLPSLVPLRPSPCRAAPPLPCRSWMRTQIRPMDQLPDRRTTPRSDRGAAGSCRPGASRSHIQSRGTIPLPHLHSGPESLGVEASEEGEEKQFVRLWQIYQFMSDLQLDRSMMLR